MEEVGKYQTLQDRIKRLTKNQASNSGLSSAEQGANCLSKLAGSQDSQKQNMGKFTFAKKRQSSQTNLRHLASNVQPAPTNERVFQSISNLISQKAQLNNKQPRSDFRKSSNQYAFRKPIRQSIEGTGNQFDFSCLTRRNQSVQNSMTQKYASRMLMTEVDDSVYKKDISFAHESSQYGLATRRLPSHGIKKSLTNLTYRTQHPQLNIRHSVNDQKQSSIKLQNLQEPQPAFIRNYKNTQVTRYSECEGERTRTLTKCRSGILQRMPGRIMKNK